MPDIGLAAAKGVWLGRIGVESDDPKTFLFEEKGQGQADVSEADDPDNGVAGTDPIDQGRDVRGQAAGLMKESLLLLKLTRESRRSRFPRSQLHVGVHHHVNQLLK